MVKVTKRREADGWRVQVDGRDTPLFVVQGPPAKFREPREWFIMWGESADPEFLVTARSLQGCMSTVERIIGLAAMSPA